jgi:hypothetical protein
MSRASARVRYLVFPTAALSSSTLSMQSLLFLLVCSLVSPSLSKQLFFFFFFQNPLQNIQILKLFFFQNPSQNKQILKILTQTEREIIKNQIVDYKI